jgi:hypothetical protein
MPKYHIAIYDGDESCGQLLCGCHLRRLRLMSRPDIENAIEFLKRRRRPNKGYKNCIKVAQKYRTILDRLAEI